MNLAANSRPNKTTALVQIVVFALIGATAFGRRANRIGRKKPLMISIAWFSVCNLLAGLAPSFLFLLLFRTLLGIGDEGWFLTPDPAHNP